MGRRVGSESAPQLRRRYRRRAPSAPVEADLASATPASSAPPSTALPVPVSPPSTSVASNPYAGVPVLGPGQKVRVAQILSCRALGMSDKEIAEKLGIKVKSVQQYMWIAGKRGYLSQSSPKERMEFELPHKIVRNVSAFLDSENPKERFEMTVEAAKGTGIFKQHQAIKQDGMVQMAQISVNVVMPEGIQQDVVEGSIGGVEGEYTQE